MSCVVSRVLDESEKAMASLDHMSFVRIMMA
jgi:hypothetical protein